MWRHLKKIMSDENKDEKNGQENNDENKTPKTYSEDEFKKLVSQRDELKKNQNSLQTELDKIKAQIKTADEDDLKKKGELQTLLDKKEAELAETRTKAADAETFKQKYEDLDKSIREKHLSELDDDELKEIADKLPTDMLMRFVEKNKKTNGMEAGRPGGKTKITLDGKKWEDFNSKDLELIRSSDFTGYSRLYYDKYKRMPTQ